MRIVSTLEAECVCGNTVTTNDQEYSTEATCPECGARLSLRMWGRFMQVSGSTGDKQ